MKFHILIVLILCIFFVHPAYAVSDPLAVDNNKFGIHILFPEEIVEASKLVNSSGGDWGYVTIPLQSDNRNLEKWQKFMDHAAILHLIPIVRLATYPITDYWPKPTLDDAVDFANFLNDLKWPVKNRYIILFNEPNRAQEWGGEIRPDEYAQFSKDAISIFKERSQDFFMLNAGLDISAPNNHVLMNWQDYLLSMNYYVPGILSLYDGWTSHAYPNPGYTASPYSNISVGIRSYQYELNFLQNNYGIYGKKIFITETGWDKDVLGEVTASRYYSEAFNNIWTDNYIVAVTPFLLSAQAGDFQRFSFMNGNQPSLIYDTIKKLNKVKGNPEREVKSTTNINTEDNNSNWSAQKTNLWHQVTGQFIKKVYRWLKIKHEEN